MVDSVTATPDHEQAERIEQLASEFHAVYQHEAKRQGDVRHHDDYEALSENVKEFDRALARYVLDREERLAAQLAEAQKEIFERPIYNRLQAQLAEREREIERLDRELEKLADEWEGTDHWPCAIELRARFKFAAHPPTEQSE